MKIILVEMLSSVRYVNAVSQILITKLPFPSKCWRPWDRPIFSQIYPDYLSILTTLNHIKCGLIVSKRKPHQSWKLPTSSLWRARLDKQPDRECHLQWKLSTSISSTPRNRHLPSAFPKNDFTKILNFEIIANKLSKWRYICGIIICDMNFNKVSVE